MSLKAKFSYLESFTRSLTKAAFLVGMLSLLASLLGMVRDRMLAGTFGAGAELDIYYAAFRVPDFFFNTILVGITSSAFLPVLTEYLHKPGKRGERKTTGSPFDFPKGAQDFINSLVSTLLVGLLFLSVILFFIAPIFTDLIAPGFTQEQKEATVLLTRIMLLSPFFLSFSGVLGNILNIRKYFFFYSLAPVIYNLGAIIAIIFFVPSMGVAGLAWGISLGAFCHMMMQFLPAKVLGLKLNWRLNPRHPGIIRVIKMMIPRSVHLGVLQLNLIATTFLASTLPVGSLTVFNFANNLQSVPLGLFGASFAIAAFPALSIMAAKKQKKEFRDEFSSIMCKILFFIIPLSAILIILRAQIVRLILGSGKFDWEDTILTFNVLGILALSLFAQSLNILFVRAFFAIHDTITPLKSGIIGLIVNVGTAILIVKEWSCIAPFVEKSTSCAGVKAPIVGLALAYTFSQIATFFFLLIGLSKYLKGMKIKAIKSSLVKIALSTLLMGAVVQIIKWVFGVFFPLSTFISVATQVSLCSLFGIAIYLLICKTLKCKELTELYNECPKIFGRKNCPRQ